jgi:hypothetical protein
LNYFSKLCNKKNQDANKIKTKNIKKCLTT